MTDTPRIHLFLIYVNSVNPNNSFFIKVPINLIKFRMFYYNANDYVKYFDRITIMITVCHYYYLFISLSG